MATHLQGRTGAVDEGATPLGQVVFSALVAALGRPTAPLTGPIAKQLNKRLTNLTDFLNRDLRGWDKNKISQQAFLRMLFRLLASDLKNRNVTPTLGILITNMQRLPEVFDASFPGYREAGIAHIIFDQFTY
jgi:hypothetical protein